MATLIVRCVGLLCINALVVPLPEIIPIHSLPQPSSPPVKLSHLSHHTRHLVYWAHHLVHRVVVSAAVVVAAVVGVNVGDVVDDVEIRVVYGGGMNGM